MYPRRIILLCTILYCISINAYSQVYEVRGYIGANYYQGDLSPRNSAFSFSPGRLAWGVMVGTKLSNVFRVNLKFMTGQVGADDANAKSDSRKARNLKFDSPIYECGINTEISINYFIPRMNKYGINIYYTTGVNLFHFSPKTSIKSSNGAFELVDLQPLGTEGQGLPGYADKYSLVQLNIPFGLGFKFQLHGNMDFGFEFAPRYTFTDYLDDVSGAYVDYDILVDNGRQLTAQLANRTGEYLGTGPVMNSNGNLRGNPEDNDWYFFGSVFFSYNFGKGFIPRKSIKIEEDAFNL